ncbi:zinc-ribbon and DUF3426 domain-containing protein [Pseudaquabacterium terrae]|uniref:zinc-ribbon and DUF3426 domain-containing protein n=1 Tax=Pseudaquabacterium terrae TaxID=2732868 RepID=UPI001FE7BFF3|nr:zinc-ribbon and DUF3426 domain-containing protein [Aquabacterium terrae]
MSLATRCTECGTVFRVVQDQLKISEGWVRCGRCSAVFNALENLCELDGEPAVEHAAAEQADAGWQAPAASRGHAEDDFSSTLTDNSAPTTSFPATGPVTESMLEDDDLPAAIVSFSSESAPDESGAPPPPAVPAPSVEAPRFVRAADRAALWRRTPVRAGLATLSLLLAVALLAQLALAGRDLLAAHLPGMRPLLAAGCAVTGCSIEPLKRIDRLSVDSSGLTRLESAALYRLSVVLHNRGDTALAAPAVDLSLTDGSGKLVARKVLLAAELGLPPVIDAGAELPLQALLSTGERRVSGYTVELFYP